jgi:transcriptional regulator with XRE-family HTH domain
VFGKALKFFRERAGLSQTELAALSNYSNTVINKIEKGDRPPTEGFPGRMDAIPRLETNGELSRLWGCWKKAPGTAPTPDGAADRPDRRELPQAAGGPAGRYAAAAGAGGSGSVR